MEMLFFVCRVVEYSRIYVFSKKNICKLIYIVLWCGCKNMYFYKLGDSFVKGRVCFNEY